MLNFGTVSEHARCSVGANEGRSDDMESIMQLVVAASRAGSIYQGTRHHVGQSQGRAQKGLGYVRRNAEFSPSLPCLKSLEVGTTPPATGAPPATNMVLNLFPNLAERVQPRQRQRESGV